MGVHLFLQVLNEFIFERVTTLFGSWFEMIGSPLSQGGWVQPYDENDTGIGRVFLHFVGRFIKERGSMLLIERLRFTFTPNGKREFVPRDQVFPLFSLYCLLFLHKNK